MMLRTTLLSALGASLFAVSVQAQTYSSSYQLPPKLVDSDETGAITSESPAATGISPAGSVPGYSDPYARQLPQRVESAPMAPPAGVGQVPSYAPAGAQAVPQQGYVQPGYVQPGYQASAPSNQPMSISPQGQPAQGGYQGQAPQASGQAYQGQAYQGVPAGYVPAQGQPQGGQPQPGYVPPAVSEDGAYAGSYKQDALLQAARTNAAPQQGYGAPQPGYVAPQQGYASAQPGYTSQGAVPVSYSPATAPGSAPPSGVYAPNAAVVPGTQEAPSGPRIESVDPTEPVPERFRRQTVDYVTTQPVGTIVIDTSNTYLYYVLGGGKAERYGIGVGREGFTWAGTEKITRKAEWPDWRPPTEMIDRQPYLPRFMAGGPGNPMGARALYLGGTIYRIHGTNEPQTIGKFVSSGCIRMLNSDVEDLFERAKVGTKVVILPKTGNAQANAGSKPPVGQPATAQR